MNTIIILLVAASLFEPIIQALENIRPQLPSSVKDAKDGSDESQSVSFRSERGLLPTAVQIVPDQIQNFLERRTPTPPPPPLSPPDAPEAPEQLPSGLTPQQLQIMENYFQVGVCLLAMMFAGNGPPSVYKDYEVIQRSRWTTHYDDQAPEIIFQELTSFMSYYKLGTEDFWRYLYQYQQPWISYTSWPWGYWIAEYDIWAIPQDGVIVRSASFPPKVPYFPPAEPGQSPIDPPDVFIHQWSDIAFLAWQKACQDHPPSLWAGPPRNCLKDLDWVVSYAISDESLVWKVALDLMSPNGECLPGFPGFLVQDPDTRNMLMATPNGRGVAWLLLNHVDELGPKYINQIYIFGAASGKPCLAWHFMSSSWPVTTSTPTSGTSTSTTG